MHSSCLWRCRLVLAAFAGLTACTNHDVDPNATTGAAPTKGSADFTKYVAIGNSLTAGFADGGLYLDGQLNSYPNILAGQFQKAGGGAFVQPLFSTDQANGTGYLRLRGLPATAVSLPAFDTTKTQLAVRGLSPTGGLLYQPFTGANQNLGVPGIKMADLLRPGYGSQRGNPYFERLVSGASPATTYYDYVSSNLNGATFFTSWLGNNDALNYATSGGTDTLTSTPFFSANYTVLINKLTENNRKGAIIGIPNITSAPYFTTVTAQIGALLQAQGRTGLVIQSKSAPGGVRLSGAGDYFLLSLAGVFNRFLAQGTGLSAANPIPDRYVLDATEAAALNQQISAYNGILKAQADAKGLAYVDPNTILTQIGTGLTQDGVTYSAQYIQGGVFSLDGIHLTPAGYALIANEIIKGINAKYGATLPLTNTSNYRRVLLQ